MAPSNNNQTNVNRNQPPLNNQPPPSGSQNPSIDIYSPNHPLYLHLNDHLGLILISKKLTGSENYSSWKRSMMIALNAKNKLKIVTGELHVPSVDSEERTMWDRTNDMIISWILNTLSDHINGHRMYQLVNNIVALKQQNCNIEVYYHKLKGLWDEHDALESPYLCHCVCNCENGKNNGDREQRKRLIQFLMGLDECYSNLIGSTALSAQTYRNNNTPRNTNSAYPNKLQTGRRSTFRHGVYCTNCSKEGHNSDECYRLKGYLIGHPLHGKYKPPVARSVNVNDNRNAKINLVQVQDTTSTSTQAESSTSGTDAIFMRMDQMHNQLNQVMRMMQQCQKNPPTGMVNSHTIRKHKFIASVMARFKTAWITDSGATDHISILLSIMHDTFLCYPPIHVTLPNGQTVEVKIYGKVRISNDITLTNVFYIPSFAYNLLFVSQLTKSMPVTAIFTSLACYFQGLNKRICHGNLCEGLYIIYPDQPTFTSPTVLSTSNKDNTIIWHSRLGHPSISTLKQIKSLPISCNSDISECTVCPLAKNHASLFSLSASHASCPFELVHVDIWGPYKSPTINKCKFFLTMVDDFSKAT
ncbi:cysteine-rich receptor-like protein kinase 8 [Tanacetum coccineum]|uniref:Cysteine-rich receptor-like protein kinase 8 n=1 Tax=Tanacetum coccineum TaxID=301880 RepID=A0ABQ4YYC1_9ASTR